MANRGMARRLFLGLLATTALIGASPTVASAAGPTAVRLDGPGLATTLEVTAKDKPDQFTALMTEVNWLYSRAGQSAAPAADKLGAKFTMTVYVNQSATQRYDLYPMADGGPRVYRPAAQPDKHQVGAGWFYGRLSLPDTLVSAGVPLSGTSLNPIRGGIGGGEVTDPNVKSDPTLPSLIGQWREFILLNGAVVVVIALGLAGISLLVRRRERRRLARR